MKITSGNDNEVGAQALLAYHSRLSLPVDQIGDASALASHHLLGNSYKERRWMQRTG